MEPIERVRKGDSSQAPDVACQIRTPFPPAALSENSHAIQHDDLLDSSFEYFGNTVRNSGAIRQLQETRTEAELCSPSRDDSWEDQCTTQGERHHLHGWMARVARFPNIRRKYRADVVLMAMEYSEGAARGKASSI